MISKASTETLKIKEIMLDVCRFFSVRVSTISIFVGMQVRVVAKLPSCWLIVISQLKSHLQSKIEHVLLHLKHHW